MAEDLERINARYGERDLPTVAMRIGVHTGPVVAGSLGSAQRLKYTVVGDAVVIAARLEQTDRVAHDFDRSACRILISGETRRLIEKDFRLETIGPVIAKGKEQPIDMHRVLGRAGDGGRAGGRSEAA